MGTNKRYADAIDHARGLKIDESIMRDAKPVNLKTRELELDKYAIVIPPKPVIVRAWVRYGENALQVDAEAVRWTERVVALQWEAPGGTHKAWVWSSAVSWPEK